MRRKIVLFIIIAICFLLQTTVFRALTFANIGSNLLWIAYRHIFWVLSRRICFTLYVHRLHQRIVQKKILPG